MEMFWQVNIHPDDTKWQQILWRQKQAQQMQAFHLNMVRVTYETASAPYLALRTFIQLVDNEDQRFLLGA